MSDARLDARAQLDKEVVLTFPSLRARPLKRLLGETAIYVSFNLIYTNAIYARSYHGLRSINYSITYFSLLEGIVFEKIYR